MVTDVVIVVVIWLLERFLPWSLLVSLALWWGKSNVVFQPRRMIFLVGLGVIEDITRIQVMGLRSVVLISLMMIAWLVARYYQSKQLWWWYALGIGGELMVMALDGVRVSVWPLLFQVVCLGGLQWWFGRFGRQDAIYVQA